MSQVVKSALDNVSIGREDIFDMTEDSEGEKELTVFQEIVNNLMDDLSNDGKELPPLSRSQISTKSNANETSSMELEFRLPCSQFILERRHETQAYKLFGEIDEQGETATKSNPVGDSVNAVTSEETVPSGTQDKVSSISQLTSMYMEQCANWFQRNTRSHGNVEEALSLEAPRKKRRCQATS